MTKLTWIAATPASDVDGEEFVAESGSPVWGCNARFLLVHCHDYQRELHNQKSRNSLPVDNCQIFTEPSAPPDTHFSPLENGTT